GILDAIASAGLPSRTRVLLVIDQFEELFRYQLRSDKDQAAGFVQRLLKAIAVGAPTPSPREGNPVGNVYVVITMRSECLGDCAGFSGLAEAVNAGLYLTPRLNREQLIDAITTPALRCGRVVDRSFVRRLVNDVANDQDQLPVLQHALMRCWKRATSDTID